MAVIVSRNEKGQPVYRSARGLDVSDSELASADNLDELLRVELGKVGVRYKKVGKGDVGAYWDVGQSLQKIFKMPGVVNPAEKRFFLMNAALHLPEALLREDRSDRRGHLAYVFRLGQYPKTLALMMKWGEWVYTFDTAQDERFDAWWRDRLQAEKEPLSRATVRLFNQVLRNLLKSLETGELSDEELHRCYQAAWKVLEGLIKGYGTDLDQKQKDALRDAVREEYPSLSGVMASSLSAEAFAKRVLSRLSFPSAA